jgi:hypothetical protein
MEFITIINFRKLLNRLGQSTFFSVQESPTVIDQIVV